MEKPSLAKGKETVGTLVYQCSVLFLSSISIIALTGGNALFVMLCIILFIVLSLFYVFSDLGGRVVYGLFLVSFATFMLPSGVGALVSGDYEVLDARYDALCIVLVSMMCMTIGSCAALGVGKIQGLMQDGASNWLSDERLRRLRTIGLILFAISVPLKIMVTYERIAAVQATGYIGLYTVFQQELPFFFYWFSTINEVAFYIVLATFPNKKTTYTVFAIYIFTVLLSILTGVRGAVVTRIMVMMVYVVIRNRYNYGEKLFQGRMTKLVLIASAVLFVGFLGVYSSLRQGGATGNLLHGIYQFFSEQGSALRVLQWGVDDAELLRLKHNNYSLFALFGQNAFLKALWDYGYVGTPYFTIGNFGNEITLIHDSIYYHAGGSFGTQYMAELFLDYGYIGIVVFHLILGFFLSIYVSIMRSNWVVFVFSCFVLRQLLFLPRDHAFSWITPFLSVNVIVTLVICYLLTQLFTPQRQGASA